MREILTSQSNVFALITLISLSGLFAVIPRYVIEDTPVTCTISTTSEMKAGIFKTANFVAGTDCDTMRSLAEEGRILPTIGKTQINFQRKVDN
jgi:hypothetical protein